MTGGARYCIRCGRALGPGPATAPCPACDDPTIAATAPGRVFPSADDVPAVWMPGDVLLDTYEVLGVLGQGGMATVYRVLHRGWGQELAVKTPLPEMLTSGGVGDVVREATAWVDLGLHPHVVTCHYVRTLGGIPRVFAELVDGGSLADHVADRRLYAGRPGEVLTRILDVAIQAAWGLAHAHAHEMIHQDVKPANLLVTSTGTVKVTDLGLVRGRAAGADTGDPGPARPPAGSVVVHGAGFSPGYESPEQAEIAAQARAGVPPEQRLLLTRRTDVWSWAVTVLELFLGQRTWRSGQAAPAVLGTYRSTGGQDPAIPAMPASLAELVGACLDPDPARRPQGFGVLVPELVAIHAATTGHRYPRPEPRPADLLAASLTNRGVSLLELGRPSEAVQALREAQQADPDLPQLVYDRALVDWHAGNITDAQAVERVRACAEGRPDSWEPVELTAWLHLERRDREAAAAALGELEHLDAPPHVRDAVARDLRVEAGPWAGLLASIPDRAEPLSGIAVTADGATVVSCGAERRSITLDRAGASGLVQVVDGSTAALRWRRLVPTGPLYDLVVVPQGGTCIAAGQAGQVVELDLDEPGRVRWQTELPGRTVGELAISDDGTRLLAVHNSRGPVGAGEVTVWDLAGRAVVHRLSERGVTLSHVAAADGMIASAASGGMLHRGDTFVIHLWDAKSGQLVQSLGRGMGLHAAAQCLAIAPGTGHLYSGHANGELRLWDLDSGGCVRTFVGHTSAVYDLTVLPSERAVVTGAEDRTVRVWEPSTGACLRTLTGHTDGLRGVAVPADGLRLVSGSRDGDVRLWDLRGLPGPPRRWAVCTVETAEHTAGTRQRFTVLDREARDALAAEDWPAALELARRARALPGMDRHRDALRLWREAAGHSRPGELTALWTSGELPGHAGAISSVAVDRDGSVAATAGADGTVRVWDLELGECRSVLRGHEGWVTGVAILPDGERLVSGGADGTVRLWPLDGRGPARILVEGRRSVDGVAATPDGRYLAAAANATMRKPVLRVFDLHRDRGFTIGTHRWAASITALAPSPDGRLLLVGEITFSDLKSPGAAGLQLHGVLRLFDLDERAAVREFEAEDHPPVAAVVALDGRRAVTTCWNRDLAVWDLTHAELVTTVEGQRGGQPDMSGCRGLVLRGDGRMAANTGDDGRLRVWDMGRRSLVRELEAHAGDAPACAWSADAGIAVTGGEDGNLRVWGIEWGAEPVPAADGDAGLDPYLETLLGLHRRLPDPAARDATWLGSRLGDAGYGWIGRRALERYLTGV